MLPPFIIEQIRKREKEERAHREQQPQLDLPLDQPRSRPPQSPKEEIERGVVILDL